VAEAERLWFVREFRGGRDRARHGSVRAVSKGQTLVCR
jgi:hypothetical protein